MAGSDRRFPGGVRILKKRHPESLDVLACNAMRGSPSTSIARSVKYQWVTIHRKKQYSAIAHSLLRHLFLRAVVDVTRLTPDARTVDEVIIVESKTIVQADVFSQHSVEKTSSRDSSR